MLGKQRGQRGISAQVRLGTLKRVSCRLGEEEVELVLSSSSPSTPPGSQVVWGGLSNSYLLPVGDAPLLSIRFSEGRNGRPSGLGTTLETHGDLRGLHSWLTDFLELAYLPRFLCY